MLLLLVWSSVQQKFFGAAELSWCTLSERSDIYCCCAVVAGLAVSSTKGLDQAGRLLNSDLVGFMICWATKTF